MNAVVTIDDAKNIPSSMSPMLLIEKAISGNVSPENLEKLLDLQERWEAGQARKAFIADMALAKVNFAPILKRNSGYNDRYKYETLSDVIEAVDTPLVAHGFSYAWETEDLTDGRIRVTCVLTHEAGHSKRNSLSGDPRDTADAKANMNGFQRMGGAVTYLQRYTLKAALGIAADRDDDGASASANDLALAVEINADQFQELRKLIDESGSDETAMLTYVKAKTLEAMTLKQYASAKAAMTQKIELKKRKASA